MFGALGKLFGPNTISAAEARAVQPKTDITWDVTLETPESIYRSKEILETFFSDPHVLKQLERRGGGNL